MVSQLSSAAAEAANVTGGPRLSLVFEKGEDSLSVVEFSVHERMNAPFKVTVVARSPHPDISLEDITGYSAGFGYRSADLEVVAWTGVCSYMEQAQAETSATGLSTYHFVIVAPIWLLTQRRGHRIFQHLTVPNIVKKILAEYRIDAKWELDDAYPKREFEVQYDETDFAFVTRLLEASGISYWFEEGRLRRRREPRGDEAHLHRPPAEGAEHRRDRLLRPAEPHAEQEVRDQRPARARRHARQDHVARLRLQEAPARADEELEPRAPGRRGGGARLRAVPLRPGRLADRGEPGRIHARRRRARRRPQRSRRARGPRHALRRGGAPRQALRRVRHQREGARPRQGLLNRAAPARRDRARQAPARRRDDHPRRPPRLVARGRRRLHRAGMALPARAPDAEAARDGLRDGDRRGPARQGDPHGRIRPRARPLPLGPGERLRR